MEGRDILGAEDEHRVFHSSDLFKLAVHGCQPFIERQIGRADEFAVEDERISIPSDQRIQGKSEMIAHQQELTEVHHFLAADTPVGAVRTYAKKRGEFIGQ